MLCAFPCSVQAQGGGNVLSGEIKDQRNGIIVNAEVILTSADGVIRKSLSSGQGEFNFGQLPKGKYLLLVRAAGFAEQEISIDSDLADATQASKIIVVLYPTVKADVEISENAEVALDAERSAGTLILNEKDLDALPDDPDEFKQELQNLAAASGSAPGGAVVTVDGFLNGGGRLPPKSAIRQIRVNPNLYSAEYDTPPFQGGRVEITTKPGSGAIAGSVFFNYNATALNARDPLASRRAETLTKRYGWSFGMPIIKDRLGFFLDFEKRDINEAAVVNAIILDENLLPTRYSFNAPNPKRLTTGSARADWQINASNTLVFRYDFNRNKLENIGVGNTNLPERASDQQQTENSFRLIETAALNARSVNELRIGLTLNRIEQNAASSEPSIIVAGSFSSGGASLQNLARRERRLELTDYLTTSVGSHNLKFGVQIYNRRTSDLRAENTNGSFYFGGSSDGAAGAISTIEQYRRALLNLPGGTPTRFSLTLGASQVAVNQWLFAGFVQDEWRINPKVSLSLGLRYEAQTAPNDAASFAPRFGIAYAPDKKQRWVLRARGGIYYERFDEALTLETERLNGRRQQQITIDSPFFPNPFANGGAVNAVLTSRIFDSDLKPPASLQMRLEVERQLPKGWKVSASHSWTFGWNRLRSRNINAPLISESNPDPLSAPRPFGATLGNILQFESSGRIEGRVLYIGVNQNSNKYFTVNAGYLNFDFLTDADTAFALPQSSYDFAGEWARPFWQVRHRLFLSASANLPYMLRLSASLNAASGAAYNVTTGRDNNGDGNFNDRPNLLAAEGRVIATDIGFLDPNAINGSLLRNAGTNPAIAALDLNLSRVFTLGKPNDKGDNPYKLTVNIRAANALNRANLTGTNGVVSSPLFGRPTTANPSRRVEIGLRFSF